MDFRLEAKYYHNPECMAADYLRVYFGNRKIEYPINPFRMLRDEGVFFALGDFKRLEGIYIPASIEGEHPIVGINVNRPITRQRFTAVHELCHHFHDADMENTCTIGSRNATEKFAEKFASAVLMPLTELRVQVNKRQNSRGYVSFDDVLEIANYFGVSFSACIYRIAYSIHAIDGDTEPSALEKRIQKYKPDLVRKNKHITYAALYAGLVDNYKEQLAFTPNDYTRHVFQNQYIYNDSRMEGLNVNINEASEIVADLRLRAQNSPYCKEENEAFLSIAGHFDMYQSIFEEPVPDALSVFDTFALNKKLFSYYPYPDFGGNVRQNNALVLGAKFETADYHDIYDELVKLDQTVKNVYGNRNNISISDYIKHIAKTHHRLTVIHPFPEGNGRTARAFMNVQLVRAELPPVYIKVEEKEEYIKALERADKTGDYDELYEILFKTIIKCHVELRERY